MVLGKTCLSDKRVRRASCALELLRVGACACAECRRERVRRRAAPPPWPRCAVLCCAHGRCGSTQAGASRGEAERWRTACTAVNGAVTAARSSASGAASVRAAHASCAHAAVTCSSHAGSHGASAAPTLPAWGRVPSLCGSCEMRDPKRRDIPWQSEYVSRMAWYPAAARYPTAAWYPTAARYPTAAWYPTAARYPTQHGIPQ